MDLLIVFGLLLSRANARPTKVIKYWLGPAVVYADLDVIQYHCFMPELGQIHDNGTLVKSSTEIFACYDRGWRTIYLSWEYPRLLNHEYCHYLCDFSKDVLKCDKTCEGK